MFAGHSTFLGSLCKSTCDIFFFLLKSYLESGIRELLLSCVFLFWFKNLPREVASAFFIDKDRDGGEGESGKDDYSCKEINV